MPELTGVHRCTRCLQSVERAVYFANDTYCDECAKAIAKLIADDAGENRCQASHQICCAVRGAT